MPRGYPALNEVQKKEIIRRVTDGGKKVSELSKEYGVVSKTIYNLLGRKANQSSAVLELSKLRRENEALLSIIGSLVAESKLSEKKALRKKRS
jgi:transposase-like protein